MITNKTNIMAIAKEHANINIELERERETGNR